jgi:colanic acid/amylovoran biosynthesis protein
LREIISELERYDVVIQVGGSFFVDLYGERQFELPLAAILARRPLYLLGHSMGPFGGARYRRLAATLLRSSECVALREPVSLELLKAAGLAGKNICAGADTAWLVPVGETTEPHLGLRALTNGRPAIAITLRDLAPFDKRLGVTQSQFEQAFADLANKLLSLGYDIIACATCTGIDSYNRDDRMPALRVREQVQDASRFHVVMDELNDIELGQLLGSCHLLVGTRLHSAIIAMNFGTPAIALNYEHKSEGILRQLGLAELSCPIGDLVDGSLADRLPRILDQLEVFRSRVKEAVAVERRRAADMVDNAFVGRLAPRE